MSLPCATPLRSGRNALRFVQALVALLLVLLSAAPASAAERRSDAIEVVVAESSFVIDAPARMHPFVGQAAAVIEANWEEVALRTGAPAGERYSVHVEYRMDDWFVREGMEPRTPEWAAGLAIGSMRTVLLAPGNPDWERTLVHELAHLAVAVAAGHRAVPRWVNEGWAVELAGQFDLERASALLQAGLLGNYLDFEVIERTFPRGGNTVQLAYAQSTSAVRFLLRRHGDDIIARTFEQMRTADQDFHRAFLEVSGESLGEATEAWTDWARARFRWAPAATGGGLVWGGMALLAVFAIRRRRKQNRDRLERMGRSEGGIFDIDPDDATFGGDSR